MLNPKPFADSLTLRSIVVGVIALVMFIPLLFVSELVNERDGLYRQVLWDIASMWGSRQLMQGPVLVIPFVEKRISKETETNNKSEEKTKTKVSYSTKYAVHLPKKLKLSLDLHEQYRQRGIYHSLVYSSTMLVNGYFTKTDFNKWSENLYRVEWDKAFVIVGVSDTKAIKKVSSLQWSGQKKILRQA